MTLSNTGSVVAMLALAAAMCVTAAAAVSPPADSSPRYQVQSFAVRYARPLQFLPELETLARSLQITELTLGWEDGAYVSPAGAAETREVIVQRDLVEAGPVTISRAAIDLVIAAFRERAGLSSRDHFVAVDPRDIDPRTGVDRRDGGASALNLVVAFEGPFLPVSGFEIEYALPHPDLPDVSAILDGTVVELHEENGRLVSWRPAGAARTLTLREIGGTSANELSAGAIQVVLEGIRDFLTRTYDFMAVYARPAAGELATTDGLVDARGGRTTFRLEVIVSPVTEVRTLAAGDRIAPEDRINHPAHEAIRRRSPFEPGPVGQPRPRGLLRRRALDEHLYLKSRHPGRRVDAAVAPSEEPLGVALDYIVTENRPLTLYAQTANTGTEETERWRHRAGLFHQQLTGHDDVLSLDLVTADFEDNNAVAISYDAPLFDSERWRWRVYGDWSEFSASELGFADARFTGESWSVGGELAWNLYQDQQLFVDLLGGVRYFDTEVDNAFAFVRGAEQFVLPYAGVRLEKFTEVSNTQASLIFEWSEPGLTAVDEAELSALGRLFPEGDFVVMRWDLSQSFFLEPLLNRDAWEDISTPASSTLAHEVALRFRGQHSFGDRLIPQFEQTAGGLYTVRGYPESVAVGDTVLLFTAEYRFHLPRALGISEEPATFMGEPFRAVPQFPYGQADWDLIFRGFVDIGRTEVADPFSFESDQTLIGVGGGVQLVFKRNVDIRLDWGIALEEVPGLVNEGSNRLHFVVTILF